MPTDVKNVLVGRKEKEKRKGLKGRRGKDNSKQSKLVFAQVKQSELECVLQTAPALQ